SNLNQDMLSRFAILKPTLGEQHRIVSILRSWDDAIDVLLALGATKAKRLSWLRSELLGGQKRLPGHTGEWRSLPLSEVLVEHSLKSSGKEDVFSVSVHKGL